jgi:hypothetical protein
MSKKNIEGAMVSPLSGEAEEERMRIETGAYGPNPEVPQQEPKLLDVSKDLYEGGKADESKLAEYVETAKQKGLLNNERLDLTGGTLMTIYMAIAAEAGRSDSPVKKFAFNNPGREGRLVLWSEELVSNVPKLEKSLVTELPPSEVLPELPATGIDLRLLFAENPEAIQNMADPAKTRYYMRQIIAQVRDLKEKGQDSLRITGMPMWLAQGAAFIAAREGIRRITLYNLLKEVVVYDRERQDLGRMKVMQPQDERVSLRSVVIEPNMPRVLAERQLGKLQEQFKARLVGNKLKIEDLNLQENSPTTMLLLFDHLHAVGASLQLEGVEIFQHLDPHVPDLVPKTQQKNPDLLPREQRIIVIQDVHAAMEAAGRDPEKAVLFLATEAVNKARVLIFAGITSPQELAVAGKVAHAAHGLIEELRYRDEEGEKVVKSWKPEAKG